MSSRKLFFKQARVSAKELEPIKKFIGPKDNPKFFFTMTEINKIGINPQSRFNTPLGVFAYPLTEEYYNKLINKNLPYVPTNPYINVFTTSTSLTNVATYSENDLKRDVSLLKEAYGLNQGFIEESFQSADIKELPISKMWNLTRLMGIDRGKNKQLRNILQWSKIMLNLGHVGFYDPGLGRIHVAEKDQAVILDPSVIIPVATFLNPYSSHKYEYSDKLKKLPLELEPFLTPEERNIRFHKSQKNKEKYLLINKIPQIDNPEILSKLSKSSDPDIKSSIARHPETPQKILLILSHDPSPVVKANLCLNHNVKENIINRIVEELIKINDDKANSIVSQSTRLSPELLAKLYDSYYAKPREKKQTNHEYDDYEWDDEQNFIFNLVKNPNLDRDKKNEIILKNPSFFIRDSLLSNLIVDDIINSEDILELMESSDLIKNYIYSECINLLPIDIIKRLCKTKDVSLLMRIDCDDESILNILLENKSGEFIKLRTNIAYKHLPVSTQLILLEDPSSNVREILANNSSITEKVAVKLAEDPNPQVRGSLARVTRYQKALDMLAQDSNTGVKALLISNHSLKPEQINKVLENTPALFNNSYASNNVLIDLIRIVNIKNIKEEFLNKIVKNKDERIINALCLNHSTPYDIFYKIYIEGSDQIKNIDSLQQRIIKNPSLNIKILEEISKNLKVNSYNNFPISRKDLTPTILINLINNLLANDDYCDFFYFLRKLVNHPNFTIEIANYYLLNEKLLDYRLIILILSDSHCRLQITPETLDIVANKYITYFSIAEEIIKHPNTSDVTLEEYSTNPNVDSYLSAFATEKLKQRSSNLLPPTSKKAKSLNKLIKLASLYFILSKKIY